MLEIYVEISGVRKYEFLLSWDGLERWVYPASAIIEPDERAQLLGLVRKWLDGHGYKTNPPD
jgi:hypothetical protein